MKTLADGKTDWREVKFLATMKKVFALTDSQMDVAMQTASPSEFVLKSECKKTLEPRETCKASVTFKPTNTTAQSGELMIYDSLTSSPQSVPLSGTGKAAKGK